MSTTPPKPSDRLDLSAARRKKDAEAFVSAFDVGQVTTDPGCYIMKDAKDRPIYVGKAKNLRARIRTYINAGDGRYSVKFLMRRVAHIDFVVTNTEKEALLLENSLIKQFKPRYNVQLKDDKTFISLRLDTRQDFPRLTVVRRYKKDGAKYFGPYHNSREVRQIMRQVQRLFPLRTCSDHVLNNRTRPCLYYQMKQCNAPCVGLVDRKAYHELVDQVVMVLEGRTGELERYLRGRIQALAEALRFEEAAALRDRLYALKETFARQGAVGAGAAEDQDVFGLHSEGRFTEFQVLFYRNGRLLDGRSHSFERQEMPLDELLASFLMQYYSEAPVVPPEVVVPMPLDEAEALGEILGDLRGGKVVVHHPRRGARRDLVSLANKNAARSFAEKRMRQKAASDTLGLMQAALQLPRIPERIECFDISTLQGTKTVASMVVFTGGEPDKARYRRFSMKTVDGQDDFGSMREALLRRYRRAIEENDLPDMVLIDGGKGQLNVATAVFKDLGLDDMPVAGIAKARTEEGGRSPERFFVPGRSNPIVLPQNGPVVQLAARIRDEAHRFAITYHRKQRNSATLRTALTDIPGIGPKRARALLNGLGSVARIREARIEEVAALPGFDEALAQQVVNHLTQADGAPEGAAGREAS